MKIMILLTLCAIGALACLQGSAQAVQIPADNQSLTTQSLSQMPLPFTKNMGQWDDRVLFRASSGGATMWFTKEGITYQFTRQVDVRGGAVSAPGASVGRTFLSDPGQAGMPILPGNTQEKDSVEQLVLTAKFVDGNPNPEVVAEGQMEYKCNYFLGNEPSKWRTDVPNYSAIVLKDIYPGIDVKYSDGVAGQAAYEFVVAPGADMSQIEVAYEGAEATSLDADGRLIVQTKWGNMTAAIGSPTQSAGVVSLRLAQSSDNGYGFTLSGQNGNQALSGATVLVYSTYLGGGGDDYGHGIAVNSSGEALVTGESYSSNFPTLNPYQTDQGGNDVIVTKLSSSGNSLIYSTYLGGQNDDYGEDIAVDGSGNAYMTGVTWSSDFPTVNPYQTDQGNGDAFVAKLSSTGNSLIYSTYLGGGEQDYGEGIAVDGSGSAYVTGATYSSNFPILNPYQANQGGCDVFVTKLSSSGNSLIFSTYLGGADYDAGWDIAVDGSGNACVTGVTTSTDFPTLNPYQTYQGNWDAFVTKLTNSGNTLSYSTYLGGGEEDYGEGIAVDGSGSAYVTGHTFSPNFPTLNPYQTYQGTANHNDAFVTKLSSTGNSLSYSTYLGGGSYDQGFSITVDGSGNAYVSGLTTSDDFPTLYPYQTFRGGYSDVFVTKLSSTGNSLIYSTYLGGGNYDEEWGIAVDGSGNAYVMGRTYSSNFPTLNPYQTDQVGTDVFVTKLRYFACTSCGDANSTGTINISDAVFLIAYIFASGRPPGDCNYANGMGDADGKGTVNISDAVYLIAYIFSGGPAPHCQGQ